MAKISLAHASNSQATQAEIALTDLGLINNISAKFRLVPAALAVLVQLTALATLLLAYWAISYLASTQFSTVLHAELNVIVFTFVMLQASTAALFSKLAGMAQWWRFIHFGFPIAIWSMLNLELSNTFYFIGFVVSLSLFWTTFRTQVPFFPSRPIVWQSIEKLIPLHKPLRLIDIGSGLGDMSMHMAKVRPDCQIEGIEIAPLPWLISVVRAKFKQSSAVFKIGDYQALNFADYDVIFAYLSPAAMVALWDKASKEMQPGSLLISLEFEIPNIKPAKIITNDGHCPTIYVWQINA
jgi:hypothetical protein